jgi:HK97 family phage prohead protease
VKLHILHGHRLEPFAIRIVDSRRAAPLHTPRPQIIVHRADEFAGIKRFEAAVEIEVPADKKVEVLKNADGVVTDYRNVHITGYLSTFKNTTESDRQGDYVDAGAFKDTIDKFMLNPVLLTDHRNSVATLAGNFLSMKEDRAGLRFDALLSNAPGNIDVRFKVAEKQLRTTSMGGIFHYKEDGRGIFKVDLWEGSLTPIPANPDARFSVRSLDESDKHYFKTAHLWPSYYHFKEAACERY